MKMTMTDGTVFEGTLKEYAELIAFAETHQTINEAKVEAEESKPKLKAGDFVKFEKPDLYDITIGKIYEVKTDDEGDLCIIDDAGDEDYSYLAQFAIKVDADEAKWAKINRKPGEFKKGDIVRVTDDMGSGFEVGALGVVDRDGIEEDLAPLVTAYATDEQTVKTYWAEVEIVAPVESTLN